MVYSKKEEYLNGKETDFQEKSRKKSAKGIVGLGTTIGAYAGFLSSKPKNFERAKNISEKALKDNRKVLDFVDRLNEKLKETGGRVKDLQTKEALDKAFEWGGNRIKANIKGMNKAFKVAKAMDNKAALKRSLKGAAIGTAVMAPLAYAANKSMKNRNEEINRSRRGKRRGLDQKEFSETPFERSQRLEKSANQFKTKDELEKNISELKQILKQNKENYKESGKYLPSYDRNMARGRNLGLQKTIEQKETYLNNWDKIKQEEKSKRRKDNLKALGYAGAALVSAPIIGIGVGKLLK